MVRLRQLDGEQSIATFSTWGLVFFLVLPETFNATLTATAAHKLILFNNELQN